MMQRYYLFQQGKILFTEKHVSERQAFPSVRLSLTDIAPFRPGCLFGLRGALPLLSELRGIGPSVADWWSSLRMAFGLAPFYLWWWFLAGFAWLSFWGVLGVSVWGVLFLVVALFFLFISSLCLGPLKIVSPCSLARTLLYRTSLSSLFSLLQTWATRVRIAARWGKKTIWTSFSSCLCLSFCLRFKKRCRFC